MMKSFYAVLAVVVVTFSAPAGAETTTHDLILRVELEKRLSLLSDKLRNYLYEAEVVGEAIEALSKATLENSDETQLFKNLVQATRYSSELDKLENEIADSTSLLILLGISYTAAGGELDASSGATSWVEDALQVESNFHKIVEQSLNFKNKITMQYNEARDSD